MIRLGIWLGIGLGIRLGIRLGRATAIAAVLVAGTLHGAAQALELPRLEVAIGGRTFTLEVAADYESRSRGLSGRAEIAEDGGMLFAYRDANLLSYWMVDCLTDMDGIFIDSTGRVVAVHEMRREPLQQPRESRSAYENRLLRYPSRLPAMFVIELKSGTAARLGIRPGVVIDGFDPAEAREQAFAMETRESMRRLSTARQRAGDDGWPMLEDAARRVARILDDDPALRPLLRADPLELEDDDAQHLARGVREILQRGVDDLVASAAAADHVVRDAAAVTPGVFGEETLLDALRDLGASRVARMRLSLARGETATALDLMRQALAMCRALAAQPNLADRIVAVELDWQLCAALDASIEAGVLPASEALLFAQPLAKHVPERIELAARGETRLLEPAVTLAWDRSGAPVAFRPAELVERTRLDRDRAAFLRSLLDRSALAALADVGSLPRLAIPEGVQLASRQSFLAELDALDRAWRTQAGRPRARRGTDRHRAAERMEQLGPPHAPLATLALVMGAIVDVEDVVELRRAAVVVTLALEAHRADRGSWPADLRSVRSMRLPDDPLTGRPFMYRPTDEGGFVLYSIGADGRDDQGAIDPDDPMRGYDLGPRGAGYDVVAAVR